MEKMINCKACGREIAKSAKTCPHCGARNKKRSILGTVLIVFGVLIAISAFGSSVDTGPKKVGESGENADIVTTEAAPSSFTVGDKVELNDVIVTLSSVTESSGGNYMTPESGKTFVLCEFEIENNSSRDISISSLLCFEAYIDGYSTNLDLGATVSSSVSQLDGTVAAGKKMRGVIGYSADKNWTEIEVRFTPDFWSGKDIIFTYNK